MATTDAEQIRSTKFSTEQVVSGLLAMVAMGGNANKAARLLAHDGTNIPARRLRNWRDRYAKRYAELEHDHAKKIEEVIVRKMRANVLKLTDAQDLALEKAREELESGKVKDASSTLRNIAVAAGIGVTKILELEGRPTQVVERRDAQELLSAIRARVLVLDSEAERVGAGRGALVEGQAVEIDDRSTNGV